MRWGASCATRHRSSDTLCLTYASGWFNRENSCGIMPATPKKHVIYLIVAAYVHEQLSFYIPNNLKKQECIPVGCVPPAHWPYLVVSHARPPAPCMPPAPCTPPAPRTPPRHHVHPPPPCMPPSMLAPIAPRTPPPPLVDRQTPVKT